MRKLGATSVAAVLCAGLTLATARADDKDGGDLRALPPPKPSWWSSTFGGPKEPVESKKAVPVEVAPARPPASDPITIQAREESAFHRRMEVCYDLLDLADKNGDDALREQVYQLMDKAWAVYQQRTAGPAAQKADEAVLTRPSRAAADREQRAAATPPSGVRQGEVP